jgi:fructan beta-fructosidase
MRRALPILVMLASLASAGQAEPWRPQVHFSPDRHWMNDPNGLVYLDGEYHLFYQYNPEGELWGHMSWGHAVSGDLVHWRELPLAIPEDERYMIFSGSIVVDAANTSGLGRDGVPVLVAIYTGAQQGGGGVQNQQLAYSSDRGRTWAKYTGNPVLDLGMNEFRDPKVFWYAPGHTWIMAAVFAVRHQVALFASPDLTHWRHLSDFGPAGAADTAWECPDLFELPVDGDPTGRRWVLKVDVVRSQVAAGSGAQYFTGRFDGTTFTADAAPADPEGAPLAHAVDLGMDFYASASWANLPDPQRHVWLAWMDNWAYALKTPTTRWRGAMSLPRELSLRRRNGTWQLVQRPVRELQALRTGHRHIPARSLDAAPLRLPASAHTGAAVELRVDLDAGSAAEVGLRVHVGHGQQTTIGYDRTSATLFVDRAASGVVPDPVFAVRRATPLALPEGHLRLHVFVDTASVEVFAADGESVLTEQVFPDADSNGIEAYARGGRARLQDLDSWVLATALPRR